MYTNMKVNRTLVIWVMHKYKYYRGTKISAMKFIEKIAFNNPQLFIHWRKWYENRICLVGAA